MRHEAEMANIARGKAECYISIEAKSQVLYFPYSMWQGSDLSVIKNYLSITKHANCADYVDASRQIWTNSLCCNV